MEPTHMPIVSTISFISFLAADKSSIYRRMLEIVLISLRLDVIFVFIIFHSTTLLHRTVGHVIVAEFPYGFGVD